VQQGLERELERSQVSSALCLEFLGMLTEPSSSLSYRIVVRIMTACVDPYLGNEP
jgi:hypothetical protein